MGIGVMRGVGGRDDDGVGVGMLGRDGGCCVWMALRSMDSVIVHG